MGYAIFTARKLMLTNRVNQLNFRLMQLSQQQMTLSDSAAKLERAFANQKSVFQTIGNLYQSHLTMQQQAMQTSLFSGQQQNGNIDNNLLNMYGNIGLNFGFNLASTPVGAQLMAMQQMQEQANESRLQQIKDMENEIELQKKSIETQLQAAQAELKSVEDAEKKQIDASAPKFA